MSTIVVKEDTDRASASAARSSAAFTALGRRIVSEASFSMHVNVRQRARTDKPDHRRLPRGVGRPPVRAGGATNAIRIGGLAGEQRG